MRKIVFTLLILPVIVMAKDFHEADTLWANNHYNEVEQSEATHYGIVKRVDTVKNVATVHFYTIEPPIW